MSDTVGELLEDRCVPVCVAVGLNRLVDTLVAESTAVFIAASTSETKLDRFELPSHYGNVHVRTRLRV